MLEKVKIGGMEYDIEQVKFDEDDDVTILGECHYEQPKILINSESSTKRKEQTLIHEIAHAMLFEVGAPEYEDEELVNRIGMIMYQVLQENDFSFIRKDDSLASNM